MKPNHLLLTLAVLLTLSNGAVAQLVIDDFSDNQARNSEISAASAFGGVRHIVGPDAAAGFTFTGNIAGGRYTCGAGSEIPIQQPVFVVCTATWDGQNDGVSSIESGTLGTGSLGGGIDLSTGALGFEVDIVNAMSVGQASIRVQNYDGTQCELTPLGVAGTGTITATFQDAGCPPLTDVRGISMAIVAQGIGGARVDADEIRLIPRPSYTVGGTLSGLAPGSTVILQNNGGDDLVLDTDGPFTFATEVFDQSDYEVTVATQPSDPLQLCTVNNGIGQVDGAPVDTIDVQCEAAFSIGGTVSGLRTPGLILDLNNQSALLFEQDGAYSFPLGVADGGDYTVTPLVSPADHVCEVDAGSGSGTIAGTDITDANVTCTTDILFRDGLETLSSNPIVLD